MNQAGLKIVFQLVPKSATLKLSFDKAEMNPLLQYVNRRAKGGREPFFKGLTLRRLTLPTTKTLSSIVLHLNKKWSNILLLPEYADCSFRIFPKKFGKHEGWGKESTNVLALDVAKIHEMPPTVELEYDCVAVCIYE